jgi:hypothetical protein
MVLYLILYYIALNCFVKMPRKRKSVENLLRDHRAKNPVPVDDGSDNDHELLRGKSPLELKQGLISEIFDISRASNPDTFFMIPKSVLKAMCALITCQQCGDVGKLIFTHKYFDVDV